jgi:hypothetical protein
MPHPLGSYIAFANLALTYIQGSAVMQARLTPLDLNTDRHGIWRITLVARCSFQPSRRPMFRSYDISRPKPSLAAIFLPAQPAAHDAMLLERNQADGVGIMSRSGTNYANGSK